MQSNLREIPVEQLNEISGGHPATIGGAFAIAFAILEVPHALVGVREFTNYVADRWHNGFENIEEGDYFTEYLKWFFTGK